MDFNLPKVPLLNPISDSLLSCSAARSRIDSIVRSFFILVLAISCSALLVSNRAFLRILAIFCSALTPSLELILLRSCTALSTATLLVLANSLCSSLATLTRCSATSISFLCFCVISSIAALSPACTIFFRSYMLFI